MAIYVLIHGGFSGGWVWREVAQRLRSAGHAVFTPTLTGLGERAHLATPEVNIATHIQDAEKEGDGWRLPLAPGAPRHQPHPLKTVTDRLAINNPQAAVLPRAYIHCTAKDPHSAVALAWPAIDQAAAEAQQQGWWFRTLPTNHSPHRTMPDELTTLLLELA